MVRFFPLLGVIFALCIFDQKTYARPPAVTGVEALGSYNGTPGAHMGVIRFSDGMGIRYAQYPARGAQSGDTHIPPIVIIAGYTIDISYLHYMATHISQNGVPVVLIQPPGNGEGVMRSGFHDDRDGYHNTIEGFSFMYLNGVGTVLRNLFREPVILAGHSRAGYQVRLRRTGLEYERTDENGKAVLVFRREALETAQRNFHSLVSLYSPLSPDPRLVQAARDMPGTLERLNQLEAQLRQQQEEQASNAAAVTAAAVALNPIHLLAGPFALLSAAFHANNAYHLSRAVSRTAAHRVEELVLQRTLALMTGERELDGLDRAAIALGRSRYGDKVPTFAQVQQDIERARWMMGHPDSQALQHLARFSSRRGPTPAAALEMETMTQQGNNGLGGWVTQGVGPDGNPYPLLRAVRAGAAEVNIPYYVFDADGDGSSRASIAEVRSTHGHDRFTVRGAHGGAVMRADSIAEFLERVGSFCKAALKL